MEGRDLGSHPGVRTDGGGFLADTSVGWLMDGKMRWLSCWTVSSFVDLLS